MDSLYPFLLFLLLPQCSLFTSAQTSSNIPLGSSLSTLGGNLAWSSPSGEFSFGFYPTQGDFLLSIWFAKIPVKTIVWTANKGVPVQNGSQVQLTTDGRIYLSNPSGKIIWVAQPLPTSPGVTSAAMHNSGNFVLSNGSTTIWSTFDNPTDTILPTQILDLGDMLVSRQTEDNYMPGRFQLILQTDGNLVLYPIPLGRPTEGHYGPYWASNTQSNGSQLVFNQSGYIYLTRIDGDQFNLTSDVPLSMRDFYHRATLDLDGVFRQYAYPKSSPSDGNWPQSWSFAWSIPQDICSLPLGETSSGVCGINSYCKLEEARPTCECPPGYDYYDRKDIFGGCKQNFFPQTCEAGKLTETVGYEMQVIPSMNLYGPDYERFESVTEEWCNKTCLNDCLCAAAVIHESNCTLKKFPFSNGRLEPGSKVKALIKVGNSFIKPVLPPDLDGNKKDKWILPGSLLLGSSACLNLLFLLLISFRKKLFIRVPRTNALGVNLRTFTYKELEEATNGFKEELGHGASSIVYKGKLQSVSTSFFAVKRLDKVAREVDKEFKMEVNAIGRTNHKNLVQLLGFCDEGSNRLLVYEYMRNGSLADLLFGSSRPDWSLRIQIAFGIARGLAYLHEDCSTQIIHCDVKPQNILIDDYFMPRISDFGLAKLLQNNQSKTSTAIRGTRGYMAPEWFKNMAITAKVDVYSFGIMLLEIICCRRNIVLEVGAEDKAILSEWAYQCCVKRAFHLLVENDEDANKDRRLERLVMVAIWSIQEDPFRRPSMKNVTEMLEGAIEVSMPPDPSSFTR